MKICSVTNYVSGSCRCALVISVTSHFLAWGFHSQRCIYLAVLWPLCFLLQYKDIQFKGIGVSKFSIVCA